MFKADVHVEVKLMQTGQHMELPVVFNQPFSSAYPRKGFDCGSTSLFDSSTPSAPPNMLQVHPPLLSLRPVIFITVLASSLVAGV